MKAAVSDRDQRDRDRQIVEPQGPARQAGRFVPVPDQQAARSRARVTKVSPAPHARSGLKTPLSRIDAEPGGQRDHRRQGGVVDMGGVEACAGHRLITASSALRRGSWRAAAFGRPPATDCCTLGSVALEDQLRVERQAEDAEHQRRQDDAVLRQISRETMPSGLRLCIVRW